MSAPSRPRVAVLGLGNEFRGDDALGCLVGQRLQEESWPGVSIRIASGEGTALMDAWQEADAVILVDAVQSGAPPGTLHRLDAHQQSIPSDFFHYSTHAFSVAEAVEMARVLQQLPPRLILYGIEGQDFAQGAGLSSQVTAVMDELLAQVRLEIRRLLSPTPIPT